MNLTGNKLSGFGGPSLRFKVSSRWIPKRDTCRNKLVFSLETESVESQLRRNLCGGTMNTKQFLLLLCTVFCAGLLVSYSDHFQADGDAPESAETTINLEDVTVAEPDLSESESRLRAILNRPEYEIELERLVYKVKPIFDIIDLDGSKRYSRRDSNNSSQASPRSRYNPLGAYSNSYGSYNRQGTSYSSGGCCSQTSDLLPILALAAMSLLLLYLIVLATTTTTAGRRRRSHNPADSSKAVDSTIRPEDYVQTNDETDSVNLDASTWLTLIHELWEQDRVAEDASCAQHSLCRMNRMASEAPLQVGWTVSLSSLPLSYLLHRRNDGGFMLYMDAALMGRSGANCSLLFNRCSRLH